MEKSYLNSCPMASINPFNKTPRPSANEQQLPTSVSILGVQFSESPAQNDSALPTHPYNPPIRGGRAENNYSAPPANQPHPRQQSLNRQNPLNPQGKISPYQVLHPNPTLQNPKLHYLLTGGSDLHFDISNPKFCPTYANLEVSFGDPGNILDQQATEPPTPRLEIKSGPWNPWKIDIESKPIIDSDGSLEFPTLTVGDVLQGIQMKMWEPISVEEWGVLQDRNVEMGRASRARTSVVWDVVVVKRIDCLKKPIFCGLTPPGTVPECHNLELFVKDPEIRKIVQEPSCQPLPGSRARTRATTLHESPFLDRIG